jgi:Bacterial Ig domain
VHKDIPEFKYNAKLLEFIDLKELHLILLLTTIFFCFVQANSSGNYTSYAQGQTLQSRDYQAQQTSPSIEPGLSVKITSPSNGQNVSTGQLTISGTSTDTSIRECEVYADWNDRKPFQSVVEAGSEGKGDYSRWNYTYTADYHEITNGTNELTSKISCLASPTNLTKWYSINVTGIEGLISSRNDSSKSANLEQGNSMPNIINVSSPITTISPAEITATRHGSYADLEGSDRSSENDNDDVHDVDDNGSEDRDEGDEEKNGENDFTIENNHDNEGADNGNTELILNENNQEEDEEDVTSENDFDDSDQSKNDSQESPYEDKDSIENNLEVFGNKGKYEDKDRSEGEESVIHSPFDIPFEVPILTIPSIPSLPTPDLEDLVKSEDHNCDMGDARFPFCDEQQLVEKPIDYDNNCDMGDARFPFCDEQQLVEKPIDYDNNCDMGDARFPFCDEQQLVEKPIDYDNNCDMGDARFPFCDW